MGTSTRYLAVAAVVGFVLWIFLNTVSPLPQAVSVECLPCLGTCPDRPPCVPSSSSSSSSPRPPAATPFLGQEMGLGRKYADPDEVLVYLSKTLGIQLNNFAANIGTRRAEVHKDDAAKMWFKRGYRGLAIEGEPSHVAWLRTHLPARIALHPHFASPENIVSVFDTNQVHVEMDLLKIDIDSADCPIMDAIVHSGKYKPKLITMEVNIEVPPPIRFSTLYMPKIAGPGSAVEPQNYGVRGCSISHMDAIARSAGYSLVQLFDGEHGADAMFVRNDLLAGLPNVPNDPPSHYVHCPIRASWPWFAGKRGWSYVGISDEWRTLPTMLAAERIWGNITQITGTRVPFTLDVPFNEELKN